MRAAGAGVPAVPLRAEVRPADLRRPVPHPKPGAHSRLSLRKNQSLAAGASPLSRASPRWAKYGLSHNQLVALDIETRARRRPGVGIVHRCRARLHNERPQFGKVRVVREKLEHQIEQFAAQMQEGADKAVPAVAVASPAFGVGNSAPAGCDAPPGPPACALQRQSLRHRRRASDAEVEWLERYARLRSRLAKTEAAWLEKNPPPDRNAPMSRKPRNPQARRG
jgi:hypothetical protein